MSKRPSAVRGDLLRLLAIETDECVLWERSTNNQGYGTYRTTAGKTLTVHRMALMVHVGPPPTPKHEAMHGPCHTRNCINYRHLSWGTKAENMADRSRDGTAIRGDASHFAQLTVNQVREIRARLAKGETAARIARDYGVGRDAVGKIKRGERWAYVQ